MAELDRDERGYPIPYVVARDLNGRARFQINDDQKVETALLECRCAICGQDLPPDDVWLVGGPQSAFHPAGAYIDTPTHYECLEYALKVCPYLAVSKYQKRIDLDNLNPEDFHNFAVFQDPTQDDARVPFFVAIRVTAVTVVRRPGGGRFVVPAKPYTRAEFWNDGRQISNAEMSELYRKSEEKREALAAGCSDQFEAVAVECGPGAKMPIEPKPAPVSRPPRKRIPKKPHTKYPTNYTPPKNRK